MLGAGPGIAEGRACVLGLDRPAAGVLAVQGPVQVLVLRQGLVEVLA